ncbi:MAG: hypothetical protein KFH87_12695, partial [Bacteroidetes bacterium]|nr:hypothetical protein [Bacteroidota bacterium]
AGYLWLSTNRGLTRFHRSRGVDATYEVPDGLQGNEFNNGAYFASPAGELFFGGVRGLTYFIPERIAHNTTVPPVVVTDVRVGNRSVELRNMGVGPDTVRLDYRDGTISFTFAALSFYRSENNRYRYRIEGRGDEWIDLGNERYLSFAGLSPGVYNLHVQGSNNDGVWNETGATVTLIVEPPFWAAWWFRILMLLLIGGLVFLGYRRRMTRIRRQERRLTTEVEHRTSELQHANAAFLAEIEERKKAEAEAYRANATKSEFLAHISHEIRTPMNAILGFAELLQDKIHEEELREYLNSITVSGKTLLTLINDVLDLSKIEAGRLELEYRPTSIRGIVDEIRQLFAYQMQRKNLTFEARISDSVHTLLYLDETRLRQILLNLVGNAVKFTEKGHISVEVKSSLEAADRCTLTIVINDTGIGIAPSQQERVFEPFRQGRTQGRNIEYQGSGLGLAITQRLVQMMGGSITLSSRLGIGSSFRVRIPAVTIVADTMEMEFLASREENEAAETHATDSDRSGEDAGSAVESLDGGLPPEELAGLYHTLTREALPRWKRLRRRNVMHEIEQFAGDMNAVADRATFSPLMEWSERLLRDVRSFDMERLPLTLDAFPEILAMLSRGDTNISPSQQEDDERKTSPDSDRR